MRAATQPGKILAGSGKRILPMTGRFQTCINKKSCLNQGQDRAVSREFYLAFFFSFFSLRFSFRLFVGSFFLSFFVTSPFVMASIF
jgi:hypothetical protein